ncbi:MAG: aldo/keto reductase [Candidatus Nanohaloarchaea archaeon]|nr:aldo/keto reductase [Candidatus Nanohaloarchaea archaeon]
MEDVKRGRGGLRMPAIGLGTWKMRGRECIDAVERAVEMGYRHVDTAQAYENEDAVGNGLANADVDREDVFLTTKVWRTELGRDDVLRTTQESLERLGTDYVDLLLVHWPNEDVPLEETLEAMLALKEEGRVRHIGVSNFTVDLLRQALDVTDAIACNQVEMHPFQQQREMVEFCREHDMVLTAYSPLARGNVVENETLQRIGRRHDASAAQVALRWLIQQEPVAGIPKAVPEEYQRENLAALNVELDDEEMQAIFDIKHRSKFVDPGFAPW